MGNESIPPRPAPLHPGDLQLPDGVSAEMKSMITVQYRVALAAEQQAHGMRELGDRLHSVESVVRIVAEAEARRLAARAQLGEVVSQAIRHFIECSSGIGQSFAQMLIGIFSSTITRGVGAVGFVLVVLSLAGVQMTVFDANRAIDSLVQVVGQCPTAGLTPPAASTPMGPVDPMSDPFHEEVQP